MTTLDEKLLNLLGLAKRAGKLAVGQDKVFEACKAGSHLVITACDVSANVLKSLKNAFEDGRARRLEIELDRTELGSRLGVQTAQIAALDIEDGFAKKILTLTKGSDANE